MKRITKLLNDSKNTMRVLSKRLINEQRGDFNPVNFLIGVAIAIVIAAVILALLNAAIPDLWNSLINKFKSIFSL